MTYVQNLLGQSPPARFDRVSYVTALIAEGLSNVGPFTQIDSIPFASDPDPSQPAVHNFTTAHAQYQYGAWYQIAWVDSNGAVSAGNTIQGPAAPLPEDPVRDWAARLLENVPHLQRQTFTGDGATTIFKLRTDPSTSLPISVTVANSAIAPGSGYTQNPMAPRELIFASAPALGAAIQVQWFNLAWPDSELAYYVTQARNYYVEDMGVAYQAALFGLDVVLMGAATALNFGSGQENFDLQSVFTRLTELRTTWQEHLVTRQDEGAPITVVDVWGNLIAAGDYIDDINSIDPLNNIRGLE